MGHVQWVRQLAIGQGAPKICVPLTGTTAQKLLRQAAELAVSRAQIAEWRADYFEEPLDAAGITAVLRMLRATLGEMPVAFTLRSGREGGVKPTLSRRAYVQGVLDAAQCGEADIVDVELSAGPKTVAQLVEAVHRGGGLALVSSHQTRSAPARAALLKTLCAMRAAGADIPKLAVTPSVPADVLELFAASEQYAREFAETPFITVAMGRLGAAGRVAGGVFGSAVTFAAGAEATAAGQLSVEDTARIIDAVYAG